MAGKKPAKPMAGQSKTPVLDPAIYGAKIRFIGIGGSTAECGTCRSITKNGMMRYKGEKFYCNTKCAEKSN
jgi:hypothetical protein